jgi:hypothetical protein
MIAGHSPGQLDRSNLIAIAATEKKDVGLAITCQETHQPKSDTTPATKALTERNVADTRNFLTKAARRRSGIDTFVPLRHFAASFADHVRSAVIAVSPSNGQANVASMPYLESSLQPVVGTLLGNDRLQQRWPYNRCNSIRRVATPDDQTRQFASQNNVAHPHFETVGSKPTAERDTFNNQRPAEQALAGTPLLHVAVCTVQK